ncbi:MAG TPA: helix-turn-helix transcriptional regulator [Streptosporangiaceae bacterium]|nr:helix-turn-helix transcriptional regulator [Streptosporangiaceae bacterium]
MTDDAYGATVAKRRLSRRLLQLRVKSGYTANHVCDMLNWGRGKVGRFEANQWKRPEMSDIRDLLRIYDVDDAERGQLEELAIEARARPWWRDYSDIFENEFPGFENDAMRIRVFMPLVLPGLLQTQDYAEAFMRIGPRPPAWRRKALDTRLRRQEILSRTDGTAPTLTAVITEASLRYQWGSRADRRDLIEHLADISRQPSIDLRIQRFTDGPPRGLMSAINIFDFPAGEPSIAYTETDTAIQEVNEPEQVSMYIQSYERAVDGALEPADTTTYLRQLADQLE